MADTPAPHPEAFIFDLFGVMISFDNNVVYRRLAEHCSEPAEAFRVLDGLMSGLNVITGRQSLHQTHALLQATLGLRLDFNAFVEAWNAPYSASMPGMSDLIARLKPNYRILLLSNVDTDYWQAIKPLHPEFDLFDALLISGELGLAKPDPAIFEHACGVAGSAPSHCFFIDDTATNVQAARRLGLQGHVFRDVPTLIKDLSRLGVQGLDGN